MGSSGRFSSRGNACLDNCLTNRLDLFGNTCPLHMLIKTDHKGFVLPAGTKLKPTLCKVLEIDCREHRKQSFYLALAHKTGKRLSQRTMLTLQLELWSDKICSLMDKCMPLKFIRMSSCDPRWMSPLVRSYT